LILWGLAVALALALRPLLAIDETRYLSVAWEMWLRHDWWVPYLNGSPYPDKPPLSEGLNGGWLVSVVAAQSVSVLIDDNTRKPTPLTAEIVRNFQPWLRRGVEITQPKF